jgi:hypothetical protein
MDGGLLQVLRTLGRARPMLRRSSSAASKHRPGPLSVPAKASQQLHTAVAGQQQQCQG